MRIATIDLGTNTCHLLIAELNGDNFESIFHKTFPVKLGEDGITEKIITSQAINRAVTTFSKYLSICKTYKVDELYATATAAVRQANNKDEIIDKIKTATGIDLIVIDGNTEASLINEGIKISLPNESKSALMMDIGGGSVEFIIALNGSRTWQKSFSTGAAFLLEKFHPSDPISTTEINEINNFLKTKWKELFDQLNQYAISNFIGASGSFQTICDLQNKKLNSVDVSSVIAKSDYVKIYNQLLHSNRQARIKLAGMKPMRVDMIVLAVIMITLILDKLDCNKIYYSNFALKEGLCNLLLLEPDNLMISNFNYLKP